LTDSANFRRRIGDLPKQVEADLWRAADSLHTNEAGILILGPRPVLRSNLRLKLGK
jgi:hypothetical protein